MNAVNLRVVLDLGARPDHCSACGPKARNRVKPGRLLLAAAVALLPVALSGCIAAVAPVLAGSLVVKTRIDGKPDGKPKGGQDKPALAKSGEPPVRTAEPLPRRIRPATGNDLPPDSRLSGADTSLQLTGLTVLPRPDEAPGLAGGSFPAFVRFALNAAQLKPGQPIRSALIDPATLASRPARSSCGSQPPAVLIDLDPDKAIFDLDDPPAAAPGLAEQLASLRAAGITILWQANLPTDKSERLYIVLAAVGLDPDRTDRLLLIRKAGESKQDRRQDAAKDWCILAMAGDSKGDFEEAFDYLRDPNGILASGLSANLGDGWFLTPQPVR